jgi:hypothetical protein
MMEERYCEGRESARLPDLREPALFGMKYDLSEIKTRFLDEIEKVSSSENLESILAKKTFHES